MFVQFVRLASVALLVINGVVIYFGLKMSSMMSRIEEKEFSECTHNEDE